MFGNDNCALTPQVRSNFSLKLHLGYPDCRHPCQHCMCTWVPLWLSHLPPWRKFLNATPQHTQANAFYISFYAHLSHSRNTVTSSAVSFVFICPPQRLFCLWRLTDLTWPGLSDSDVSLLASCMRNQITELFINWSFSYRGYCSQELAIQVGTTFLMLQYPWQGFSHRCYTMKFSYSTLLNYVLVSFTDPSDTVRITSSCLS